MHKCQPLSSLFAIWYIYFTMTTTKKSPKKVNKSVKKASSPKQAKASVKPSQNIAPKKSKTAPKSTSKKSAKKNQASKIAPPLKKPQILQSRMMRGLLLALVLTVFGAGLFILAFQVWKAPSLAKYLPADSTIAFAEGDLSLWQPLANFLTDEELGFDGTALIQNNENSPETIHYTYENHKWTPDADIPEPEIYLKKDPNFMKMRPNLPYDATTFVYFSPQKLWEFSGGKKIAEMTPTAETGLKFLEKTLSWFPATGVALTQTANGPVVQSYTVGDKSLLKGDALFHIDDKYQGKLVSYFPKSTQTFIGGQNLSLTFLQTVNLLNAVDGLGGWALYLGLENRFKYYFGDEPRLTETLSPLFANEYALGYFPEGDKTAWVLAVELTDETALTVSYLRDLLMDRGYLVEDTETSTLSQINITASEEIYLNIPLYILKLDGKSDLLYYFLFDNILFLSLDRAEIEEVLSTLADGVSERFSVPDEIVQFSDHIYMRHLDEEWHLNSGLKLFDDGLSTLHVLSK